MEDDKFKDLLEDEELKSLRLAALATKQIKQQSPDVTIDSSALPINSIITSKSGPESASSQIPFVQNERNAFNNNYSWRKQNVSLRRRGGAFPKNNQRSNLIVINPVAPKEGKDIDKNVPALILPQHKWCNSGNEDSMSPKTLRKTGPTRFNRHGSDSESSESDLENEIDSGSNETVLQDEPVEHFSRLSSDSDPVPENVEKKRRLSFQNLVDSDITCDVFDQKETTCIYNVLKNPSNNQSETFTLGQNSNNVRQAWNHSTEKEFDSYKQHTNEYPHRDTSENFVKKQRNSSLTSASNGESHIETNRIQPFDKSWSHSDVKPVNSYYSRETSAYSRETAYNAEHGNGNFSDKSIQILSKDDLRLELQKRGNDVNSSLSDTENQNGCSQTTVWDRNRSENICSENAEASYTNVYRNENEYLNLRRNRNRQNFDHCKNEHHTSLIHGRHQRSLSAERNKHAVCSNKDKSNFDYSSPEKHSKNDNSSINDRNRHERNSFIDRGKSSVNRNWYKRSTSRDRIERSASRGRHERSSSRSRQDYNRHVRSSSRNRHERSISKNRHERSSSKIKQDRSSSESRHDRSSSRTRCDRSSSRIRRERSLSRTRHDRSSSRTRRDRSLSRTRRDRSSSRTRRDRSSSRTRRDRSSSRTRRDRSSSRTRRDRSLSRTRRDRSLSRTRRDRSLSRTRRDRSLSRTRRDRSLSRTRRDRSLSRTRRDRSLSKTRRDRSLSRTRRDRSSSRARHDRSSSRMRCNRSSSRGRHDNSSSRSRYDRSSSRSSQEHSLSKRKHDNSSSRDLWKNERGTNEGGIVSSNKINLEHSYNEEKEKYSLDQVKSDQEYCASQSRKKLGDSQCNNRHDYGVKSGSRQSEMKDSRQRSNKCQDEKFEQDKSFEKRKHSNSSHEENVDDEITKENKTSHTQTLKTEIIHSKSKSFQHLNKLYVSLNEDKKTVKKQSNPGQSFLLKKSDKTNKLEKIHKNEKSKSVEKYCSSDEGKKNRKRRISDRRSSLSKQYRYSRSRSISSTSSSSSSSSHNSRPKIRSVSSVIKSVQPKHIDTHNKLSYEIKSSGKNTVVNTSQSDVASKKNIDGDYSRLSVVKSSRIDIDFKASDNSKRVPVHMRLGVLPRKRVIQMPKDVKAAFVNSSSSSSDGENVNTKCKRQNIRIVTDVTTSTSGLDYEKHQLEKEKSPKRSSPDLHQVVKSKRLKIKR